MTSRTLEQNFVLVIVSVPTGLAVLPLTKQCSPGGHDPVCAAGIGYNLCGLDPRGPSPCSAEEPLPHRILSQLLIPRPSFIFFLSLYIRSYFPTDFYGKIEVFD